MTTTEDANKPLVIADGKLAEQWDVIQYEADQTQSRNGAPMFGDTLARTQSAATTSSGKHRSPVTATQPLLRPYRMVSTSSPAEPSWPR
jgi:hypothetical protein